MEKYTLGDILKVASMCENKGVAFINGDDDETFVSYKELYKKSLGVLFNLQAKGIRPGQELLLQIGDNYTFVSVFWACIMGGFFPVPVSTGNGIERCLKVVNIWNKLKDPFLIVDPEALCSLNKFLSEGKLGEIPVNIQSNVITPDEIMQVGKEGAILDVNEDNIAFIQFSSGSTGSPKGVILSHKNILTTVNAIIHCSKITVADSCLTWMPLTHDMGLIGLHITMMAAGIDHYIMPTSLYIRRPSLWMKKASEHRTTILSSPNFGFKFLLDDLKRKEANNWDLSSVRLIFNGAEPISSELCNAFLDEMQQYSLKRDSMFPVYGMAEAGLAISFPEFGKEFETVFLDRDSIITGKAVKEAYDPDMGVSFVEVGTAVNNCQLRICDENDSVQDEYVIGQIQIKGQNVTRGYYRDELETKKVFTEDGWLRTGDLGLIRNGHLIVTGRAKDIIFINGQNYYPQDIENAANGINGLGLGEIVACSVPNSNTQREDILVFILYKKDLESFAPLAVLLKDQISRKTGLQISAVIPIKKIPKTTSGKVQRFKLVEKFINGEYQSNMEKLQSILHNAEEAGGSMAKTEIERVLIEIGKGIFGLESIPVDARLLNMGVDSLVLTRLHDRIDKVYPETISIASFFEYPSIRKIAKYIEEKKSGTVSKYGFKHEKKSLFAGKTDILDNDIAIIGMHVRFPKSSSMMEFWKNIKHGINLVGDLPEERKMDIYNYMGFMGYERDSLTYSMGAYLEDIDKFDCDFFDLSKQEADLMNPIQRIFIEAAWNAIEDAGYPAQKLSGTDTGVYIGFISDLEGYKYKEMIHNTNPYLLPISAVGNLSSVIPGRISYILGLKGPSMLIDTACSSSLVAIDTACNAIRMGTCEMAIAGGVKINMMPIEKDYYKIGIESSDYMTKTFDEDSDGSGIGEGVAVVVLKPLNKAIDDRDNIYAIIKGSAVNQDGKSAQLTAPNPAAQTDVIVKAWKCSNIDPETISYIECHGTGTKIGDLIEIEALKNAFEVYTDKKQFCAVSTIKTNMGHLYDCAGIAGLAKAVLALKNRIIPTSILFEKPNKKIPFESSPVYVNTISREWNSNGMPRRCGVSSFGISGTNCHMVLEEAPDVMLTKEVIEFSDRLYILTMSAKTEEALRRLILSYDTYLRFIQGSSIRDICYTSNTGRDHYGFRLAVVAQTLEKLSEKINHLCNMGLVNDTALSIYYSEGSFSGKQEERRISTRFDDGDLYSANELICRFNESGKRNEDILFKLCSLYVKGFNINWEGLYEGEFPKRVSVPVYPFERKRCWLDIPERVDNSFYKIEWKEELTSDTEQLLKHKKVLILTDSENLHGGVGQNIVEQLRKKGACVVEAVFGEEYHVIDKYKYVVGNSRNDFNRLLSEDILSDVSQIIHMASLNTFKGVSRLEELECSQKNGVYSLLNMVRVLIKKIEGRKIDLVVLSDYISVVSGGENRVYPEKATMVGLGKVVKAESTSIGCRVIDIDDFTGVNEVFAELNSSPDTYHVALRNGKRFVEEFKELEIKSLKARDISIKENGVYVITGGTGGIGLELARYLASKEKIHLFFISRSLMPQRAKWNEVLETGSKYNKKIQRAIKFIMDIENKGSTVECISADVSNMEEMLGAVESIRRRYGRITGIIHGAGIGEAELLVNRSEEDFNRILAPKVYGTWILDKLTRNDNPDFFILISSAATLFGTPGEGDYTAANYYLDAYSAFRNRLGGNCLTINWPPWKETGMANDHGFTINTLFKAIMTDDAVRGFGYILDKDISRVFNGDINFDNNTKDRLKLFPARISEGIIRRMENYGYFKDFGKKSGIERLSFDESLEVKLTGRADGNYNHVEKKLGSIYKDILRLNEINIHESFFELGGDSFKAASLIAIIRKEFNVDASIREMLSFSSIEAMAKCIKDKEKISYSAISQADPNKYYSLSPAQKRMYVLRQLEGEGIAYNNTEVFIMEGNIDRDKVENTFSTIIDRHESLRTTFKEVDGKAYQIIHDRFDFKLSSWQYVQENDTGGFDEEKAVDNIISSFIKPFNLEKLPLIRVGLIKIKEKKYVLILDTHHIITDGVSMSIIFREFAQFYSGRSLPLPGLQYRDFSEWQNKFMETDSVKAQAQYWLERFNGEIPALNMHTDYQRPLSQSFEGDNIRLELGEELSSLLNNFAVENNVTPYIAMLAAYNILLSKYTGQEDIVVGSPAAGRPNVELMGTVGMFVNTLTMRNNPGKGKNIIDFVMEVRENTLKAFENQDYQFEDLIEKLNIKREAGRNPLFDTMFVLENIDYHNIEINDLKLTRYDASYKVSKFDFILFVFESKKGFYFMLEYNTSLYMHVTMQMMLMHYVNILREMISSPNKRLIDVEVLSELEKKQQLFDFNNTDASYDISRSIHKYIETQVVSNPQNIAAIFEGESMTYMELNDKANQLSWFLVRRGVVTETVVGIMMDRSFDMLISIIAILKAGGAYLPIDKDLPEERILYMLRDSGAKLLLTNSKVIKDMRFTSLQGFEANNTRLIVTEPREYIKEFDSLPVPDRSLIDIGRYKNKIGMASVNNCISLQTTRGCPYKCLYCHKIWSKNYVHRSEENIYGEIEYYYKRGVTNFAIIDDCFNLDMENGSALFKRIIKNKLKLQIFFPNGLRGDILTPGFIDLMVEAGTRGINLSLETASPRLQKMLKKNLDLDRFKEVVSYISKRHPGVILEMATMHGFPTETEEEAMMTLNFIKDIKWIHFPYVHILKIFPNTEMEKFALENGVSRDAILKSKDKAFHELPETLPFPKAFTRKYQASFLNEYFLSKERLKQVLPVQMKILDENALAQKYNAYLPAEIRNIEDIIKFSEIDNFVIQDNYRQKAPDRITIFDSKFVKKNVHKDSKRILFLDLSQHFSSHSMLYKVCEQPLGHIYLLTYLKQRFGEKIDGRIYKSGNDFDSFEELKSLVEEYKPELIGIRTLTFFKEFFHETVSLLKQWVGDVPIITGGPYASSDYDTILKDENISLVIFGEGEYTLAELVEKMLENNFKIPATDVLRNIKGIAFPDSKVQNDCNCAREIIPLDLLREDIEKESPNNLELVSNGENLSYVMYTSGTTGRPKGIMVEHKQVNNCILWMQDEFKLKPSDIVVQRTNLAFDPSVWEIFWPLYQGAAIKLLTGEQSKDAEYLIDLIGENNKQTVMYCPASLVTAMTYLLENRQQKPKLKLKWLIIGAEPIAKKVVDEFYSYFEGQIVNTYGPTECTINNTFHYIGRGDQLNIVPIGKPISNNRVYILSKNLRLLPLGVPGEICIAGDSVARGYINNMEKTSEFFIDNPFGEGKMYKSGDIGKWMEDGNIEIFGRVDQQVKIRGYRVELEEVRDSILTNLPVQDCVVAVRDNNKIQREEVVCKNCGITSLYPGVNINEDGICDICSDMEVYKSYADKYFGDLNELSRIIKSANVQKESKYDCVLAYSGGRGAAYALYKLVAMGFKVLAMTYDNGYFTKSDIENIKEITCRLNVDHIVLKHQNSDLILRESLRKAHTVCKGCFQTSSALAMEYAYKNKIKVTVGATLSRGQIIENKLFPFYKQGISNTDEITHGLLNIQINSPDIDKNVYDLIDIDVVKDGTVYDKVIALDFFRYCNVTNPEMISFLNNADPYWKGRKSYAIYSTNCPIKQIGDYCYLANKEYHYYGSATSWEKRLGHITLDNVKEDLHCKVTERGYDNFIKRINLEKKIKSQLEDIYLCAYVVLKQDLLPAEFREGLAGRVPDYMIPSYFIKVDKIPLTSNGKVDFKALQVPQKMSNSEKVYEAPSSTMECTLIELWKDVLEIDCIDVNDNFFDLGGHSLKATILNSRIQKELNIKIPLSEIFKRPTVKELATYIESMPACSYSLIEPMEVTDEDLYIKGLPLSSSQKRIIIGEQIKNIDTAFNMTGAILMEGELKEERLKYAFKELIERHESLRTYFEFEDGRLVQKLKRTVDFELDYLELDSETSKDIQYDNKVLSFKDIEAQYEGLQCCVKEFIRPFDLSTAPLLRAKLVKLNGDKFILLFDMHHIISDGVTMSIVLKEIAALYEGKIIPDLRIQYKDYCLWQQKFITSELYQKQEKYWLDIFSSENGEMKGLRLPTDFPRSYVRSFEGEIVRFCLPEEIALRLKNITSETGTTLYMLLMAGFKVLLYLYSGQEDITVGSPAAGRIQDDLENIVGLFVNMLPMRDHIIAGESFKEFLFRVKDNAIKAYENQDYPFEELVGKIKMQRDVGRSPLFDTVFAMQNAYVHSMELQNLKFTPFDIEAGVSRYDFAIQAIEKDDTISFIMEYCTQLYKKETAERIARDFVHVLQLIANGVDIIICDIRLEGERADANKFEPIDDISFNF